MLRIQVIQSLSLSHTHTLTHTQRLYHLKYVCVCERERLYYLNSQHIKPLRKKTLTKQTKQCSPVQIAKRFLDLNASAIRSKH